MIIRHWRLWIWGLAALLLLMFSPAYSAEKQDETTGKTVVGNSDTKRYHLPGMPYYKKVEKYHRVYFNSEQEAIEKGYYKAGTGKDLKRKDAAKQEITEEPASKKASTSMDAVPAKPEKSVETPPAPSAPVASPTPKSDAVRVDEAKVKPSAPPMTLEESISIALKNSLIIHMAKEGVTGAQAQKKEAFTGFLPKFSTTYSYTRLNEEPGFYFPGIPPTIPAMNMTTGTINNYNWVIEARQPLFAGGGILANYQAGKIGEEAAQVEETAKTQDVVQDVKIAYYNVLRTQRLLETAKQSVEMLKAHCDVAKNFFRVGLIPKNDMLQAEVELANGSQALVRAQNAVELAKSRLNTVLKRDLLFPVNVVDVLDYKPFTQSYQDCLDVARQNRSELKLSRLRADQAGKMVRVAASEYFPSLGLVGNYARFGDTPYVSGSDYKDMESWQVMAVASWNFWEWGKTKYRADAMKARENQAIDSSKEINDQIALEIKNAYLVLQEAESQIAVSQKVIEQAEENFRISEARYRERVARSTEVLDAQTLLTKAKSEYANALGDYHIQYARLQRAMGVRD